MASGDRPSTGLFAARAGQGDPLLLVHGGWEDRRAWDGIFPLLSTGFEVIAVDRRGHGSTSREGPGPTVRSDAEDLARALEGADLFPAHVAAHASGATSALALATERPELVRSLLLHEPPFLSSLVADHDGRAAAEAVRGRLRQAQALARSDRPEEAARAYLSLFAAANEGWEQFDPTIRSRWTENAGAWAAELDDPDLLLPAVATFRDVPVPVLLTLGERSPVLAQRIARALEAYLPNAVVQDLPAAGHLPHLFAPSALVGTWASFLLDRNVPPT